MTLQERIAKMTLQEKFTQQHVAKIRLSESAQIGEFGSSEETKVTPGTYNVYKKVTSTLTSKIWT